jgi:hypothetical protein
MNKIVLKQILHMLLYVTQALNTQARRLCTPPKQHHKTLFLYTVSPEKRYVARFGRCVLCYILFNIITSLHIIIYVH